MENHQHGTERAGKSEPRVRPASTRAEPSRSMVENDNNFGQEADEEGRYWVDARTVGIRERETGVCRQEPIRGGRRKKIPRRAMLAGERHLYVAFGRGR